MKSAVGSRLKPFLIPLAFSLAGSGAVSSAPLKVRHTASKSKLHHAAPLSAGPMNASGTVYALVELFEQPTVLRYHDQLSVRGESSAMDAAKSHLATVSSEQATFAKALHASKITGVTELYRMQRAFNGIAYLTDQKGFDLLRTLPGVKEVHRITPKKASNAHTIPFIGVPTIWSAGLGIHGEGVKIGIIDTGIDYTHANFGGPGTPEAYGAVDKNADQSDPTLFGPTAVKVKGGHDFAGATYNADPNPDVANGELPYQPIPHEDNNPIDGAGHGSHVSGTAAGFGVTADHKTYTGSYDMSSTRSRWGSARARHPRPTSTRSRSSATERARPPWWARAWSGRSTPTATAI
jgi:minor extracellular serine protease Vpr